MKRLTTSPGSPVIRRFFRASLAFGLGMGVIFPFYSLIFATFSSVFSLLFFSAGCLVAGMVVGLGSFQIGKHLLLDWLRSRSDGLGRLGDVGAVLDLNKSRELGELSPNFTRFFVALDGVILGLKQTEQSAALSLESLGKALEAMQASLSELAEKSASGHAALSGLTGRFTALAEQSADLSRNGERVLLGIGQEETLFRDIDGYGHELRSTQEKLSLLISTEFHRTEGLMGSIAHGVAAFRELSSTQKRLETLLTLLLSLAKAMQENAAKSRLLAMNTAIEAARAGAAGTGFTVIAKEMGAQSAQVDEQARHLTKELESIVADLSAGTKAIGVADRVFGDIRLGIEASQAVMQEMDVFSNSFEQLGTSLQESLFKFNEVALELRSFLADFGKANQQVAGLSGTEEVRLAATMVNAVLGGIDGLAGNREAMAAELRELVQSVSRIEAIIARFRLLDFAPGAILPPEEL